MLCCHKTVTSDLFPSSVAGVQVAGHAAGGWIAGIPFADVAPVELVFDATALKLGRNNMASTNNNQQQHAHIFTVGSFLL